MFATVVRKMNNMVGYAYEMYFNNIHLSISLVPQIEPRAFLIPGKHPTTELQPQPLAGEL